MVLKKVAKEQREREENRSKEVYVAGDRGLCNPRFNSLQLGVLHNHRDFVDAVQKHLEDYCVFESPDSGEDCSFTVGGPIPDEQCSASLESGEGVICLDITQAYEQPGAELIYARAEMRYDPGVDTRDLDIVRNALRKSGLECTAS